MLVLLLAAAAAATNITRPFAHEGRRALAAGCWPQLPRPHYLLHLRKTAGMATFTWMKGHYHRTDIPGPLSSDRRDGLHTEAALRALGQTAFFGGHVPFGVHRRALPAPPPRVTYVLVMREPEHRIVSSYFYRRATRADPLNAVARRSLPEYLRHAPDDRNSYVRVLADVPAEQEDVTRDDYERARYVLRTQVALVGLFERLDDTLELFEAAMYNHRGGSAPAMRRENTGGPIPPRFFETANEAARRALREAARWDSLLYADAVRRFEDEWVVLSALKAAAPAAVCTGDFWRQRARGAQRRAQRRTSASHGQG